MSQGFFTTNNWQRRQPCRLFGFCFFRVFSTNDLREALLDQTHDSQFKSRRPSGSTTSILRPTTSIRLQISSANGISNSPPLVLTTRIGVPVTSSPIVSTSLTFPINEGACAIKQGDEATTGVCAGSSNTEQPTKSDTKYFPAGNSTRCANGISTSSPRRFSASEIAAHPSNQYTACPA